jgi:hypothetical protein
MRGERAAPRVRARWRPPGARGALCCVLLLLAARRLAADAQPRLTPTKAEAPASSHHARLASHAGACSTRYAGGQHACWLAHARAAGADARRRVRQRRGDAPTLWARALRLRATAAR